MLKIELRALCVPGKHLTNQAMHPIPNICFSGTLEGSQGQRNEGVLWVLCMWGPDSEWESDLRLCFQLTAGPIPKALYFEPGLITSSKESFWCPGAHRVSPHHTLKDKPELLRMIPTWSQGYPHGPKSGKKGLDEVPFPLSALCPIARSFMPSQGLV